MASGEDRAVRKQINQLLIIIIDEMRNYYKTIQNLSFAKHTSI